MATFHQKLELIQQHIYQVSELTFEVRQLLEASYPSIWVEGEISNLAHPQSGHLYFSLKDEKSQVRCAFFRNRMSRLNCDPENGLKVKIKAHVSLYENRGDFQLIVSQLEETGLGDLQAAFEILKQKLAHEGLFSTEHKKSVPRFPKAIGIITSASGAAVKDIISTCERRYPIAKLLIYPVQVQGKLAAKNIAQTLNKADQDQHCDILIIGRGGGSLEDLWAFNEEILARTIFNCQTPIISAVGHDIDFTISDFVADVRAPTPTAAAELATPDSEQLIQQFDRTRKRLLALVKNMLINRIQRTDMLTRRLTHPRSKLKSWQQLNMQLSERLQTNIKYRFQQHHQQINNLERLVLLNSPQKAFNQYSDNLTQLIQQLKKNIQLQLNLQQSNLNFISGKLIAISPQSTLDRGYAIVSEYANNNILRSVKTIAPATQIQVRLADGSLKATTDE